MDFIGICGIIVEFVYLLMQVVYHVINGILFNCIPGYAQEKSVEGETILITGEHFLNAFTEEHLT